MVETCHPAAEGGGEPFLLSSDITYRKNDAFSHMRGSRIKPNSAVRRGYSSIIAPFLKQLILDLDFKCSSALYFYADSQVQTLKFYFGHDFCQNR